MCLVRASLNLAQTVVVLLIRLQVTYVRIKAPVDRQVICGHVAKMTCSQGRHMIIIVFTNLACVEDVAVPWLDSGGQRLPSFLTLSDHVGLKPSLFELGRK